MRANANGVGVMKILLRPLGQPSANRNKTIALWQSTKKRRPEMIRLLPAEAQQPVYKPIGTDRFGLSGRRAGTGLIEPPLGSDRRLRGCP